MDDSLRQLIEAEPETTPRSKLEPYYDVIRELRRKRRTYQQISRFLAEHVHLSVAASTIHAFVTVRAKRRSRMVYELPDRTATNETFQKHAAPTEKRGSREIQALRQKPRPDPTELPFQYDENEVLKLHTNTPGHE